MRKGKMGSHEKVYMKGMCLLGWVKAEVSVRKVICRTGQARNLGVDNNTVQASEDVKSCELRRLAVIDVHPIERQSRSCEISAREFAEPRHEEIAEAAASNISVANNAANQVRSAIDRIQWN